MVAATLSSDRIKAGEELVRLLDRKNLRPEAAFWLYDADSQGWKLVLTQAKLRVEGPRSVYRRIQQHLRKLAEPYRKDLPLHHVAVVPPDAPIVSRLRTALRTGPDLSGVRLTNNVIDGTLIEDAYVYRLR